MRREIIRPQHRQHAMRLVTHRHLAPHCRLELAHRRPLEIGVGRNLDLPDHRRDFGPRFPIRLAGFAADQIGELLLARTHFIGEAAHRLDPERYAVRRPFGPGSPRRGDFGLGIADLARPHLIAGRRFGRNQPVGQS